MKLSVFTPTNNISYLPELYDSLRLQSYQNWEWVLIPNEQVTAAHIPTKIRTDKRVRVIPYQHKNIGALKRFACDNCKGEAFLEVDHDDILAPSCLKHVHQALQQGAGFVHSDDACFYLDKHNRLTPHVYDAHFGWESYPVSIYGTELLATRSFAVDAKSLCEVYHAPDHIRVWERSNYYRAGGHDSTLLVGDDHDLLCRTYLTGRPWAHTDHCDYLYRYHPENSVKRYNKDIRHQQDRNRDKYLVPLIEEWARRTGGLCVDYSGNRRLTATIPLPQADSSVAVVRSHNLLPWATYDAAMAMLNEFYRILQPGGWLLLQVPSAEGPAAFMPGYKSWWSQSTLKCLTEAATRDEFAASSRARFIPVRLTPKDADNRLIADLLAVKPGYRLPGKASI